MVESLCKSCIYCIPDGNTQAPFIEWLCTRGIPLSAPSRVLDTVGRVVIECIRYHRVKYPTRFERILNTEDHAH
jgi:hypothetical protein